MSDGPDWQCPECDRWFVNHDPQHELCVYCRGQLLAAVDEFRIPIDQED